MGKTVSINISIGSRISTLGPFSTARSRREIRVVDKVSTMTIHIPNHCFWIFSGQHVLIPFHDQTRASPWNSSRSPWFAHKQGIPRNPQKPQGPLHSLASPRTPWAPSNIGENARKTKDQGDICGCWHARYPRFPKGPAYPGSPAWGG